MNTSTIAMQRISIISARPFDEVLARIGLGLGHPEMNRFRHEMLNGPTPSELEGIVGRAIGPSGLMEFARHDLGAVIRKEGGSAIPKSVRLILGNPVIMKEMVKRVPDAGSYAPVAALAGYLREINWPHRGHLEIQQGDDMGMPSRLHVDIPPETGASIRVSGTVRIMN